MTKREKQALDDAQNELAYAKALRWSYPADGPDLDPPTGPGYTSGFLVIGGGEWARVVPAWSKSGTHGWGSSAPEDNRSGSQGSRKLYSTMTKAYRALRNDLEHQFARRLAAIDAELT